MTIDDPEERPEPEHRPPSFEEVLLSTLKASLLEQQQTNVLLQELTAGQADISSTLAAWYAAWQQANPQPGPAVAVTLQWRAPQAIPKGP